MAAKVGIENLYRPIFEIGPAAFWAASAIGVAAASLVTGMPVPAAITLTASSAAMATLRSYQAIKLMEAKVALAGNPWWTVKFRDFDRTLAKQGDRLYLGKGFQWTGKHTERAEELNAADLTMVLPPKWLLKALGRPTKYADIKGENWIHGLEPNEIDISMPWEHVEGNWAIFGTTGSGKTRLYEMLVYQMVMRGDTVIFFDPKFDRELRDTLKRACERAGRPEAFAEFHPAFPTTSVRIDTLANFGRPTEIAERIIDPMRSGGKDSFSETPWRIINAIVEGLLYVKRKPSLKLLRTYAEGGPEPLLQQVLERFFRSTGAVPDWENHVTTLTDQFSASGKGGNKQKPALATGTPRQQALVQLYIEAVPDEKKLSEIGGLVSISVHSRDHLGKMIMGLLPLLMQLTSGPLGDLLSPDYDAQDDREILDMAKVVSGKRVLYVATDSLPDGTVGSAMAGMFLSDLRAYAGARYNNDDAKSDQSKIHIVCDEAAELVTSGLIAIMNKGRGAGMITYLATQNFSDYVAKFGDEHMARMVVGNGNNVIALRTKDPKTHEYIASQFGEVSINQASRGVNSGTESEAQGLEFRGGKTTTVGKERVVAFPSHLLGKLPDLHYVALISGGKAWKGRFMKLAA